MTRYTLKQLKEMVRSGIAMDLTKASNKEYKELIARGGYTQVGLLLVYMDVMASCSRV